MSLGPSPLYAAAAVAWPPAVEILPEPVRAELVAWLEQHCGGFALEGLQRVVITDADLHVWRYAENAAAAGVIDLTRIPERAIALAVAPLISHPSVALLNGLAAAGVLACAAVVEDETGRVSWRCNVPVDAYGRHLGEHADGTIDGGQATWPNMNAADQPPPAPPAEPVVLPNRAQIRVVLGLALDLCNHLPDAADTCPYCPKIRRAADAVLAMIGAPS